LLQGTTRSFHRTSKVVVLGAITCSLLLPQGLALADSVNTSSTDTVMTERMNLAIAAGEIPMPEATTADPTKVKFSKEKAVAKVLELFPMLKDAETSNITLGINNTYPAPVNQMVWDIQWNYQIGNAGYGFSSQVDAISGDLINTYVSFPFMDEEAYYPPKISREQALVKAHDFITKAVTSISVKDLHEENVNFGYANQALFGPVQYSFYFTIMKNGIPSQADAINISVNANGDIVQFSKPSDQLSYPSSKAKITEAEAIKKFKDELDIELCYIPIRKTNQITDWIMGYRPQESGVYPIDAITGKRISNDGTTISSLPVTYSEVPQTKNLFKSRNNKIQLSAEEAGKIVQDVAQIPAGFTLQHKSLSPNYLNPKQQTWNLYWAQGNSNSGFQSQYSAEVDADTGEIIQFQINDMNPNVPKQNPNIPKGLTKLSKASAKQKSIDLINRLYANAPSELKVINHEDGWNFQADSSQYRYEFQRFYKGIPVSDGKVGLTFDTYGRLRSYSAYRNAGLDKITDTPVIKVTKDEALEAYRNQYTIKLQYSRFGGYYSDSIITKVQLRLVYNPSPIDILKSNQVLDAVSGKWVSQYDIQGQLQAKTTPLDIKGHSAEKDLTTLVEYGILTPDPDGKLNPDAVINVGDWLSMMVKSITPYYEGYYGGIELKPVAGINTDNPLYSIVTFAVDRQWIKNDTTFQPEKELTREQLAIILTSIVKYSKISLHLNKDTSVSQFSDANDIQNKGAVAIAIKLGLLEGENGKFNPQQKVTKAQAASTIMKLVKLQGMTDQSIGQQR
jgi:hypothetical protein